MKKIGIIFVLLLAFQMHGQQTEGIVAPVTKPEGTKTEAAEVKSKEKIRQDIKKRREQRRSEMAKAKKKVEKRIRKEEAKKK